VRRRGYERRPHSPNARQVRAVLQALQSVLDLAAAAEMVTLPTIYLRTWRGQLQGVLAQLPAFSANTPPAHARERARKSLPGAGVASGHFRELVEEPVTRTPPH
jgi:hypothetical protein